MSLCTISRDFHRVKIGLGAYGAVLGGYLRLVGAGEVGDVAETAVPTVAQGRRKGKMAPHADERPGVVGPRTVHAAYRTLRACLSWGVRHGGLPANPLRQVTGPPVPPRPGRWWDAATVAALPHPHRR
jgi:hypothetical protein